MIALYLEDFGKIWFTVFGAVVGSFLNAVIYRLPRGYLLSLPSRSICTNCCHKIKWYENIPLLSYILLRGKCSNCGSVIGPRYFLVEAFTALLFFATYRFYLLSFETLFYSAFIASLIAVTFIDIDFRIIPDEISIGGTVLVLLLSHWVSDLGLVRSILGILTGAGTFYVLGWVYEKVTSREGLGFGDVKLLAFIGAALGPKGAAVTIILSSFIGSIIGLTIVVIQKKNLKLAVPYGPFLAIAAMIFVFWGDSILLTFYP